MKIGIFGGTFDPIHIVHLLVAGLVRESLDLDEIWFMPARVPPHKEGREISPSSLRLKMVQIAVKDVACFRASAFELERPGPSYTIDTIRELTQMYRNDQFYFIIGGDMIDYLPEWHMVDELIQMVQFVGVERPGFVPKNKYAKQVIMVDMPQMDISSTEIRKRIKEGKMVHFMVTEPVRKFIEENKLYES